MQVFKSRAFRRVYSFVSLVTLIVVSYVFVTDNISSTTYSTYFKHDIDVILDSDETVDLVFVGASRMYQSIVPNIIEEKLGYDNVLVASTAMQPVCGTYYYIKELIDTVHPKEIVIDATWDRLLNEITPQPCLLVYDRLSVKNRIPFVFNCFETEDLKYLLGPCRYRDNILLYSELKEEKKAVKERDFSYFDSENDYYAGKGFVYTYNGFETGSIPFEYGLSYSFSDEAIVETNLEYLNKCIELCKANDIKVSLVTAPCSLNYMYFVEGYEDAVEWYKKYAEELGITYYNLNYLKNRESILPDEMMFDNCHTNGAGAKVISEIYGDILLKERNGEDVSDLFYENFQDLKEDVHRIVAVSADIVIDSATEGGNVEAGANLDSLHNEGVTPLYQIEIITDDGNVSVLSEWTCEEYIRIELPGYTGYTIKVRAKSCTEGDLEAYQCYVY